MNAVGHLHRRRLHVRLAGRARSEDVGVELPVGLCLDRGADPEEAAAVVEVALERGLLLVTEQGRCRRVEEHDRAVPPETRLGELVVDLVLVGGNEDRELAVGPSDSLTRPFLRVPQLRLDSTAVER